MTTYELSQKLLEYPSDTIVMIAGSDGGYDSELSLEFLEKQMMLDVRKDIPHMGNNDLIEYHPACWDPEERELYTILERCLTIT